MKNTLFKIFLFFFVVSSAYAQDVSPELKFDDSGYVDDLAGEHAPDMGEEAAPELKELKPVKKIEKKKKVINVGPAQSFQGKKYSTDKGMSLLTLLAIGGVVILLIVGALAYFFVVKKSKFKVDEEELEDFDKDIVHKDDQAIQQAPEKVADPSSTVVYSKPSLGSDLAAATRIDEMGRNPSGIIVDEDKYFAAGDGFVDEDLQD